MRVCVCVCVCIHAVLLMFMSEEDAFWSLVIVVEEVLKGYFSPDMLATKVRDTHIHTHMPMWVGCYPSTAGITAVMVWRHGLA